MLIEQFKKIFKSIDESFEIPDDVIKSFIELVESVKNEQYSKGKNETQLQLESQINDVVKDAKLLREKTEVTLLELNEDHYNKLFYISNLIKENTSNLDDSHTRKLEQVKHLFETKIDELKKKNYVLESKNSLRVDGLTDLEDQNQQLMSKQALLESENIILRDGLLLVEQQNEDAIAKNLNSLQNIESINESQKEENEILSETLLKKNNEILDLQESNNKLEVRVALLEVTKDMYPSKAKFVENFCKNETNPDVISLKINEAVNAFAVLSDRNTANKSKTRGILENIEIPQFTHPASQKTGGRTSIIEQFADRCKESNHYTQGK